MVLSIYHHNIADRANCCAFDTVQCSIELNGRNVGGKNWAGDTVVGGKESHLFMVF